MIQIKTRLAHMMYLCLAFIFIPAGAALSQQIINTDDGDDIVLPETLSLEDAIRIGLEQNFGILIAKNEAEIARRQHTIGNAGFLPVMDLNAAMIESEDDITTIAGGSRSETLVRDLDRGASVDLGWTIFDGLRMFTSYSRLGELRRLGEVESQIQVENTITDITNAYFNIVRTEKQLEVFENSVETSRERRRIARDKYELGSGSEYDLLLARTDFNADSAAVVREEVELNDARLQFIRLLNLPANVDLNVISEIELVERLDFEEIYRATLSENRGLEAARLQRSVAGLELTESRQQLLPTVEFQAGYGIDRDLQRRPESVDSRTDYWYYGLTARFNIFNGFNTSREIQTARIQRKNSELALQEQQKFLETVIAGEYRNYESTRSLIELEMENLSLAERTLEIALERFSLGTTTSLELRESQRNLLDTETRLISAQFEAKLAETELLRLSGRLIQQFAE
ncbi:MAG: TolC family protein [Balneolia bacterium]|nr:TolC family protein [Balneolia bacterium]